MILVISGLAVYGSGLTIAYYGDDFESIHTDWHRTQFFRPAQFFVLQLIQTIFGLSPVPIHVIQLLLHVILSYLVYRAALDLGFSIGQAILASTFMLVSQANAFGVLSNSTLSQVGGAFFGYVALWFIRRAFLERRLLAFLFGLGSFAVALLFKETSVAFFLMMLVTVVALGYPSAVRSAQLLRTVLLYLVPYATVLLAYLILRHAAGAIPIKIGTGRYEFSLGVNVLKNAALLLFSAATPVSSVRVYELAEEQRFLPLCVVLIAAFILTTLVLVGLREVDKWLSLVLISLVALSVSPTLLLAHVSELYTYNAMPLVSLLVGAGLGALLFNRQQRIKPAGVFALIALLASHVVAVQHKTHLMWKNGWRASELLGQVVTHARAAPQAATLRLENSSSESGYSIFIMPEFSVLTRSKHVIQARAQRPDVRVEFSKPSEPLKTATREGIIRLRLQKGRVIRVDPNDK